MAAYEEQICKCFGLFKDELDELIKIQKYNNMEAISEDFGYGSKCGNCVKLIENIIYELTAGKNYL